MKKTKLAELGIDVIAVSSIADLLKAIKLFKSIGISIFTSEESEKNYMTSFGNNDIKNSYLIENKGGWTMQSYSLGPAISVTELEAKIMIMPPPTRYEEFENKRANVSNEQLIKLAKYHLSQLCKTGGKSFSITVPPQIDDIDIVFTDIINRFEGAIKAIKESNDQDNDQFRGKH